MVPDPFCRIFAEPRFSVHDRCNLRNRTHQMSNLNGFMQLALAFCRSYRSYIARIADGCECWAGSTGRAIVTVTGSIPVPGHSRPDSKVCTRIGEATLPNRQRNRPDERERKNDPIPLPCTHVYGCLKNAQIVAQSRKKSRARNALRAAELEPHIISPQADPIRPVYIRANRKTSRDYPPHLSRDDFVPLFTCLQRYECSEDPSQSDQCALDFEPKTKQCLTLDRRRRE